MAELHLAPPLRPTLYFIGVSTGRSAIRRVFPRWMEALGRPEVALEGVDLPLQAHPTHYRQVVDHIRAEPLALGALVTSHKMDLLAAARDRFDSLDRDAALLDEVSCIAKEDGRLVGRATDPEVGGRSLRAILGPHYFARTGGHVLILGAGGAGTALCVALARHPDRPPRLVVVEPDPRRLAHLAEILRTLAVQLDLGGMAWDLVENQDPARNDALLAELPPASVAINATGMGKDRSGSPLTDQAVFPRNGVVWDLNYRGALNFLRQARAQQAARNLTVADGWDYFVRGWARVIEHVLHLSIGPDRLEQLAGIAARLRTG